MFRTRATGGLPLDRSKGKALDVEQKTCTPCGVFCHSHHSTL